MEQSDNQPTIICPTCKSENPDISVCLTCGSKIKREQLNTKDLISRPAWLTFVAGVFALAFIAKAFKILYQKNEMAVVVLIIGAVVDISIAFGLWQLKKWAWIVVVMSCCVHIIFLWIPPIMLWLDPSSLKLLIPKVFYISADKRIVSMAMMGFLKSAIVLTILYGSILKYFFRNQIRGIFLDNPVIWRVSNDPVNWRVTRHE